MAFEVGKVWWRFPIFGRRAIAGDETDEAIVTTKCPTHPPLDLPVVKPASKDPQHTVSGSGRGADTRANSNEVGDSQDILAALEMKLIGCNTASSTLTQLLSCRTHDRLDLQYELSSLQLTVFYDQIYSRFQLGNLRKKLHNAKMERRRKSRILEDAREELKNLTSIEERLKDELESMHVELFMIKIQLDEDDEYGYDD